MGLDLMNEVGVLVPLELGQGFLCHTVSIRMMGKDSRVLRMT